MDGGWVRTFCWFLVEGMIGVSSIVLGIRHRFEVTVLLFDPFEVTVERSNNFLHALHGCKRLCESFFDRHGGL